MEDLRFGLISKLHWVEWSFFGQERSMEWIDWEESVAELRVAHLAVSITIESLHEQKEFFFFVTAVHLIQHFSDWSMASCTSPVGVKHPECIYQIEVSH